MMPRLLSPAEMEPLLVALGVPAGQRIVCDWPPKALSPNSHGRLRAHIRAKKRYREDCQTLARVARVRVPANGIIRARLDMFPRRLGPVPDDDNALASFKHGRDGIALALNVDDRRFSVRPALHRQNRLGCMVFTILEGEDDGRTFAPVSATSTA